MWNVTPSPPPTFSQSSNHVFFLAGRWSTSGWGGNAHFLSPHKNTIEGNRRKQNRRTKLGVTKSRGRYATLHACAFLIVDIWTIASVGYWRKFHNATGIRHLETLLHWTLFVSSPLCSGVWCWLPLRSSTPTSLFASLLSSLNCLLSALLSNYQLPLLLSNYQLLLYWVASSTLIRLPVPLPGTARFHVQESFVWFRAKTDNWIVCFGSLPP